MAKIKYTKNELKRQKDDLKMFTRYLPTLILKKQQLQLEITKAAHAIEELEDKIAGLKAGIDKWVDVFAENAGIKGLIRVEKVRTKQENIAGIDIEVFEAIDFRQAEYDFMKTPLWVDFGIKAIKDLSTLKIEVLLLKKKQALLAEELRITTQRVNLFEKIKIPEAHEHIRTINIALGDMQTAAVVTGKIAKRKIERKYAMA